MDVAIDRKQGWRQEYYNHEKKPLYSADLYKLGGNLQYIDTSVFESAFILIRSWCQLPRDPRTSLSVHGGFVLSNPWNYGIGSRDGVEAVGNLS